MNNVETIKRPETPLKVKTILVAVDLSPHSERTVDYAVRIARRFGASLKVIHVYVPPASMEFGTQDACSLLEKDRQDFERRLVSLVDRVRDNYPDCEYLLRTGSPSEEVARAANIVGADLIITARHHQTFLGQVLNLDQGPKIVHRAACPVLVWEDDD